MLVLPPDGHVHSEWSWDAIAGSMERSCARAVELGLASIAFTEHADFTRHVAGTSARAARAARAGPDGRFLPPPLDTAGYLACVERCRDRFPGLRILAGTELGEPHWHADAVKDLLSRADFDRVLGSVHFLAVEGPNLMDDLFGRFGPDGLMRAYLDEVLRLAQSSAPFAVLAHIDFPLRYWPASAARFDPAAFEDEYRAVLSALARSGRALEVNTVVPLPAVIVRWWHEVGGAELTFGSDAHRPGVVARDFADAAAMAEAAGFRPGRYPHDVWRRGRARAGRSVTGPGPGRRQ